MKNILEKIYNSVLNEQMIDSFNVSILDDSPLKGNLDQYYVFLSVSDYISRAYVYKGKGDTFEIAIKKALGLYLKEKAEGFKPVSIKIDIVDKLTKYKSKFYLEEDLISYRKGIDGIAFDSELEASFLPDEVMAYQLIEEKKIKPLHFLKAFTRHSKSPFSSFVEKLESQNAFTLYKFNTKSYYFDNITCCELYRGHQIFKDINRDDLWSSIELTKDNYFKNVVNSKGKFVYSYHPHNNTVERSYNILRHAGTVYSMLETYELMPDEELLQICKRAISYLLNKSKITYVNDKQVKVIVERDYCKIGGNALSILALAKYTEVTDDNQYIPIMQDLATWITELLDKNGKLIVHKQKYSTGKASDFVSRFYPGEAIFALVRIHQIDKNEKWLDAAEKIAHYLINIRDKNASINSITTDHWLLYGLNELYRKRRNELYLKHSLFIARATMLRQLKPGETKLELEGGHPFKPGMEPKATHAACQSEGLGSVYRLALECGYKKEALKIRQTIHDTIKFQLQMQFRPESTMYLDNKKLITGAIHRTLKDLEVRNDYTQHNISSFISYYNILNNVSN